MKLLHNSRKNNFGFSLAEILISLVIISVGTVGVGKLYASMIIGNSDSKNRFEASTLAEAKLESLRFSHKVGDSAALANGEEEFQGANGTFILTWGSKTVGQGQAVLVSTVKWKNRNGEYTDDTKVSLVSLSSDIQGTVAAVIAAKPDPVFELAADACETIKNTTTHGGSGWTSKGAYGSTDTSPTSCGSGVANTGSS